MLRAVDWERLDIFAYYIFYLKIKLRCVMDEFMYTDRKLDGRPRDQMACDYRR